MDRLVPSSRPQLQLINLIQKQQEDFLRIGSIVLKHLSNKDQTVEEEKKIEEWVWNNPHEWPIVPPQTILPEHIIQYISNIHNEWCFNESSNLVQLWTADIYKNIADLNKIQSRIITPKMIDEIKKEFAGISLLLNVILFQKGFDTLVTNKLESILYGISRLKYNLPKLHSLRKKVDLLKSNETAQLSLQRNKSKNMKSLSQRKTPIEEKLDSILFGLDIGLTLWDHYYCNQYFLNTPLNAFGPKPTESTDLSRNLDQIKTYISMVREGWIWVHERKWISTIPLAILNLQVPLASNQPTLESIKNFTKGIETILTDLYPRSASIFHLYLQSCHNLLSWEEFAKINNLQITPEEMSLQPLSKFLADSIASFEVASTHLLTIHYLYENRVCKLIHSEFIPFDEFCIRLFENFIKVFGEKNEPSVVSEKKLNLTDEINPFCEVISLFSFDLVRIRNNFEKQITKYLPPIEMRRENLYFIGKCKNLCRDPALLSVIFQSYRNCVIFTATKVLPAIAKARKALFNRFKKSLIKLNPADLIKEREELVEFLQILSFIHLKPLLELFITIRDIHAVLLLPKEGSRELEKGLHLIPEELMGLIVPEEISQIIEEYINKEEFTDKNPSKNLELPVPLVIEIDWEYTEEAQMPPLQYNNEEKTTEILSFLKDTQTFKIAEGEKRRKVWIRLRNLGIYKVRNGKGDHIIIGHNNTSNTFSLPTHETLSFGVAKELEKWVNREILGTDK